MATRLTAASVLTARSGMQIPVIGLNTLQVMIKGSDGKLEPVESYIARVSTAGPIDINMLSHDKSDNRKETVQKAINLGYKHIDTAYVYESEKAIGDCLKEFMDSGKIKREDIFVTTKLPNIAMQKERVGEYLRKSLESLQLDYVDLYLIHHPVGFEHGTRIYPFDEQMNIKLDMETDLVAIWKAMEDQVLAGKARYIGMSNFTITQLERVRKIATIQISNIQAECHIYCQQKELRAWAKEHGVVFSAYACLGSPAMLEIFKAVRKDDPEKMTAPLADPVVKRIAEAHKKTASQVLIRYVLQSGAAVAPKTSSEEHMKENINVFDFELSEQEIKELDALDQGEDGRRFSLVGFFKGYEKHPECPFPIK